MVKMTLREFTDHFQQEVNDPASVLTATEEAIRIVEEKHKSEINISIEMV